MNRLCVRLLVGALAAVSMFGASTADAAYKNTAADAVKDCGAGHDPLLGHYSVKVLQTALRELRASSLQYTTCEDALTNAIHSQLAAAVPKRTPPGHPRRGKVTLPRSGGVTKPTPSGVKKRLAQATTTTPSITFAGQTVTPGAVTVRSASFLSSLPTPLLIVLAALLATVLAVSARAIHQIVRARRPH